MPEQTPFHAPTPEAEPRLTNDIETIRDAENFIRATLGATNYKYLSPNLQTKEAIDRDLASVQDGKIGMDIMAGWALSQVGRVHLRSEFKQDASDEEITALSGFVDEDSFAFVWAVMDQVAEVDAAASTIEDRAEGMLAQLKQFIDVDGHYDRIANDPRLVGLLHLNAAVEFTQVRDFEAALTHLEAIPEPRLRERFIKLLAEAMELELNPVGPEDSEANLERYAHAISAQDIPPSGSEIDTRITTNRSLKTFMSIFSPFSDGRIRASVHGTGSGASNGRPSSGDHPTRRNIEDSLGHHRRLFMPRIIYGSLIETDRVADKEDPAWAFGRARFVLRESSNAAQRSSFSFGDSINGHIFDKSRRLLRPDAERGSKVLQDKFQGRERPTSFGEVTQYIEAQVAGVHITDVEAIILRPEAMGADETNELLRAAETAALHGIKVKCIFDWEDIKSRGWGSGRHTAAEVARVLKERLKELKEQNPHVELQVDVSDETDTMLFSSLDPAVASLQ